MKLVITTPTAIVVNADNVSYVRAEDSTGAFGIQPGHADFLTALAISVLTWREGTGLERLAAVRGGVFRVRNGNSVELATREAVLGQNLRDLRETVLAQMTKNAETEQTARFGALSLQRAAIQQLYRYLRPGEQPRDPLVRKP